MYKRPFFLLFFCTFAITLPSTCSSPRYNLIFDLNGVCVVTNRLAALRQLNLLPLLPYIATTFKSPQQSFYKLLNAIEPYSMNYSDEYRPRDEKGTPLPSLMCSWLDGTQTDEAILQRITSEIAVGTNPRLQQLSWLEKLMGMALARLIFTPIRFATIQSLHPSAIALIKACKKAGYPVYILSNWDAASFTLIKKLHPDFFNLFDEDHIIISGTMQRAKPALEMYQKSLHVWGLQAKDCLFIDDQLINITAAQKVGLNTILCVPQYRWYGNAIPDLGIIWQNINAYQKQRTMNAAVANTANSHTKARQQASHYQHQ